MLELVTSHRRRQRFVEVRQSEVGEVEQLVLSIPTGGSLLEHPASDRFTTAAGTGTAENDGDADL